MKKCKRSEVVGLSARAEKKRYVSAISDVSGSLSDVITFSVISDKYHIFQLLQKTVSREFIQSSYLYTVKTKKSYLHRGHQW